MMLDSSEASVLEVAAEVAAEEDLEDATADAEDLPGLVDELLYSALSSSVG